MKYTLRETDRTGITIRKPRWTIEYGDEVIGYIHSRTTATIIVMLLNRFQTEGEE